jgi:ATP-dependent protease ClpP protease subunit
MMRNAGFMTHQISTAFSGNLDALEVDLRNTKTLTKQYVMMCTQATGLSIKVVKNLVKDDLHLTAEECLRHGFIHEIQD